jgi:hypothetical protein
MSNKITQISNVCDETVEVRTTEVRPLDRIDQVQQRELKPIVTSPNKAKTRARASPARTGLGVNFTATRATRGMLIWARTKNEHWRGQKR